MKIKRALQLENSAIQGASNEKGPMGSDNEGDRHVIMVLLGDAREDGKEPNNG